jgi:hypothetical protein
MDSVDSGLATRIHASPAGGNQDCLYYLACKASKKVGEREVISCYRGMCLDEVFFSKHGK